MISGDGIHRVISPETEYLYNITVDSEHPRVEYTIPNTGPSNNTEYYKRTSQTEITSRPDPLEHISMAYKAKAVALGFNDINQSWPQHCKDHFPHAFVDHQAATCHTHRRMMDGQNDVPSPKNALDATLLWCDSSYATAGAFNEDIAHPNPLSPAAQENSFLSEPRSPSGENKMLPTQTLQPRASRDDLEATKYLLLLADIYQFYSDADETGGVVVKLQIPLFPIQDSIRDPIFSFREDCSSIFASIATNKNILGLQQCVTPSMSSKSVAELHISDNLMYHPVPPGAYLTPTGTQPSTPATSPSTRRSASNRTNQSNGTDYPGLSSESYASDTPSEPESNT